MFRFFRNVPCRKKKRTKCKNGVTDVFTFEIKCLKIIHLAHFISGKYDKICKPVSLKMSWVNVVKP